MTLFVQSYQLNVIISFKILIICHASSFMTNTLTCTNNILTHSIVCPIIPIKYRKLPRVIVVYFENE